VWDVKTFEMTAGGSHAASAKYAIALLRIAHATPSELAYWCAPRGLPGAGVEQQQQPQQQPQPQQQLNHP
jgi:hypothetical protein